MAPDRITVAIENLIGHILPPADPHEDPAITKKRQDTCYELVKTIIDSPSNPSISSDVNHASDLIKRKLIQSNPTQALRFSDLYSRLLAIPVLNKKWAILYLLYQLSDSPDPNDPPPLTLIRPSAPLYQNAISRDAIKRHNRGRSKVSTTPAARSEDELGRDALLDDSRKAFSPLSPLKDTTRLPQPDNDRLPQQPEPLQKRAVAIKSTLLAGNLSDLDPSEVTILRDLPFTLQGLSSATLPFARDGVIRLPSTLPLPMVSILHTLAEPSLLYRRLDAFCQSQAKGLLEQSLRSAIHTELRSYLTLIATLEGQIRRALSTLDESAPRGGIGKAGVTLKRCVVWTREAAMGLRLMCHIADESENHKGGQLITLIHTYASSNGDPLVAAFAERLLGSFTRPFYDILRHWIYDGELSDPSLEFFVKEKAASKEAAKAKSKLTSNLPPVGNVWEDKYEMDKAMIPSIISEAFAQKIFLIGKSLNFIRHSCGDSLWVEEYSKAASKELRYGDTLTVEAWIDEAHKTTMKRLMDLMENKFHLFAHLQALKDYILLGQGDFIALLMESLAANLDRPSGAQYRHTLTAQLEHAIRGSNAQYDSPEVLRRLDARMLQLSHGDIGWDCFTLEYKIDAPVDVVVTEWGNRQYLKVFNFLWRIKRVEFALLSTWRECMTGSRRVLQTPNPVVAQTWKSTRGTLAEMIHFVGQLQYYILFEVIESSWGELQKRMRKDGCTLDDVIDAHRRYLEDITHKGLLGPKIRHHASDPKDRSTFLDQLSEILRFMLHYRDTVVGLYGWSSSDYTRRQEAELRSMTRRGGGDDDGGGAGAGAGPAAVADNVPSEFPALQDRLKHLGGSFRTRLQILLGDLAYQPDVDMRFLGVAMNFNDVYQPSRRKAKSGTIAPSVAGTSKS
ncbi:Spindle pole body component alp6 [Escovopsis weberi]|uniref:Spindle pole body component alp6 n=1 Tax=Escovopsis weberi TaxID=150374 RepID=A0A0M8N5N8_ESCWE|nr:Spindle pole body component alp6 [Escovopsis weberi]